MEHICAEGCNNTYPEISEEVFYSEDSKNISGPRGVRYLASAFGSEINDNHTEDWRCNYCWWNGWWDV